MLQVHPVASGGWLVIAVPGTVLAIEASARPPVEELLGALESDRGTPAALEILVSRGLSRIPSFGLVREDPPGRFRCIVRGPVVVELSGADGRHSVSGAGVDTWLEQSFTGVESFQLSAQVSHDGISDEDLLPLGTGAVWADFAASAKSVKPVAAAPPAAAGVSAAPAAPTAPVSVSTPSEPSVDTIMPPREIPAPAEEETRTSAPPVATAASERVPGSYDHLFGTTIMRTVEDAAVRPAEEGDATDQDAATGSAAGTAAGTAADPENPATAVHHIDGDPEDPGDHDGLTMMSGDLHKLRAQRSPGIDASDASAADESAGLESSAFRLELPGGVAEVLDRPVIVGRAPSVSKVPGAQMPHLVTVGGTDPDISRNHVRFTVEGGTVVVTDLHSRNGTLIVLPGKAPQKLRQGEPTSVIAGTVVDLGGGISMTVTQFEGAEA